MTNNPNSNCRLGDIAEIQLGYQHREKVVDVRHGSHRLIQGKDVVTEDLLFERLGAHAGWRIAADNLQRVTPKGNAARYRLRPGDVLFVARGTDNVAVPLNRQTVQPFPDDWDEVIAAYTFYVLRPDRSQVLPEYLAWFINQPPAQAILTRQSRGSRVKLLPKSVFAELEISLPTMELQTKIVELELLRTREESLLRQLIAARQQLVQQACLLAIDAHSHTHQPE